MNFHLLLSLPFLFFPSFLGAQFEHCQSSTDQNLWDVYFLDDQTGVAVGDSGTIIRSTDGGLNWNTVLTVDSVHFKKVAFFNELNGLAVGTNIFKTGDGGMTWSLVPLYNESFYDVEIFESGKCLISGNPVALVRSEDYGMSWDTLIRERPDNALGLIDFIDEQIGYACVKGPHSTDRVLKTTDGGKQWNMIQTMAGQDISIIETLEFYSESIGFRGGWYNPHLMRTENSAVDWSRVGFDSSAFQLQMYDLHIADDQQSSFFGCGWHGRVVRSDDLGQNWYSLESTVPTDLSLYGIYFLEDQLGWIVGQGGTILRTENGGGSVATEHPERTESSMVFPNPTEGKIQIETPGKVEYLSLLDVSGAVIFEKSAHSTVDLNLLEPGVYFLIITTDTGRYVKKVVKKNNR